VALFSTECLHSHTVISIALSRTNILYEISYSIQFSSFCLAQYHKFASKGFTICTHTASLSQDLTSDQEKLPRNRKKTFTEKKRQETFRRATEEDPSPRMQRRIDVM